MNRKEQFRIIQSRIYDNKSKFLNVPCFYWKTITRCVRLNYGEWTTTVMLRPIKFRDISKRKNSLIKEIRLRASSVQVLSFFFFFKFLPSIWISKHEKFRISRFRTFPKFLTFLQSDSIHPFEIHLERTRKKKKKNTYTKNSFQLRYIKRFVEL